MRKKVTITTLGCKVNQYESAAFKSGFDDAGIEVVSGKKNADIVVVNTCAVTAPAGAQSRQAVRKALRQNPDALIIITGCYVEISNKELVNDELLKGRRFLLIGNSKKDKLVQTALEIYDDSKQETPSRKLLGTIDKASAICHLPVQQFGERSRAYLRIQDGCESYCTYCIVPYTRGPSRSLPVDDVIKQAETFANAGHNEIVLTGIHLGHYGKDLTPKEDVGSLLEKLSEKTPQTHYRISSLEPTEITDSLLRLMSTRDNIQPHLHIPLQAGCDEILEKMNRTYTTNDFRKVITKCGEAIPDIGIGIDILTGFPGETEDQFSSSLNFLEELSFSYLHVFPYSIRPGTIAAEMIDQVPKAIKDQRVAKLRELSNKKQHLYYQKHLGERRKVLIENKRDEHGKLKGFTDNYIAVRFDGPDSFLGGIGSIRLDTVIDTYDTYVLGTRIRPHES